MPARESFRGAIQQRGKGSFALQLAELALALAQLLLDLTAVADIDEGDDHAVDLVFHSATRMLGGASFDDNLRRGLGSALRALEERRALARKLEAQAQRNDHPMLAASWSRRAKEFEQELAVIRDAVRRLDNICGAGRNEGGCGIVLLSMSCRIRIVRCRSKLA